MQKSRRTAPKLVDYHGKPVRGEFSQLFMTGVMVYQKECGQPTHIFDDSCELWDDNYVENPSPIIPSHYMKWIGVRWHVDLILTSGATATLFIEKFALDAFHKMLVVGERHSIEVDERIKLPGSHAAVTDMMREHAMDSMSPKFFICGDALDRKGERYVREDDMPF